MVGASCKPWRPSRQPILKVHLDGAIGTRPYIRTLGSQQYFFCIIDSPRPFVIIDILKVRSLGHKHSQSQRFNRILLRMPTVAIVNQVILSGGSHIHESRKRWTIDCDPVKRTTIRRVFAIPKLMRLGVFTYIAWVVGSRIVSSHFLTKWIGFHISSPPGDWLGVFETNIAIRAAGDCLSVGVD